MTLLQQIIMVTCIVPDHFVISMLLLILALYVSGRRIKHNHPLKIWQTVVYFVLTAGTSLNNGLKIFFSALFVNRKRFFRPKYLLLAVILFTSKLAGNSEIIAILASGVSFKRLLRPYLITCIMLSALSYVLSAYVIPHGTVVRQNFETMYKNKKKNTSAENVQLQVDKGVIAYMQHYDNNSKRGYGFCLDKFQDKKLVSHLTALEIQYDTISESKYH